MVVLIARNEFDHQSLLVAIAEKYECCVLLAFEDNLFKKSGQTSSSFVIQSRSLLYK